MQCGAEQPQHRQHPVLGQVIQSASGVLVTHGQGGSCTRPYSCLRQGPQLGASAHVVCLGTLCLPPAWLRTACMPQQPAPRLWALGVCHALLMKQGPCYLELGGTQQQPFAWHAPVPRPPHMPFKASSPGSSTLAGGDW
jgi:hypothetical protein